jgi:hypothetical protein
MPSWARFEDSGHFAHIEEPAKFLKTVLGFVARRQSTTTTANKDGDEP